ncbi:Protein T06D8.5 [Aphelenchoides avenae]|nr:Protein T06D8.5 [Aphelenchus avenae]
MAIGGLGRLKESRFAGVSSFQFRDKVPPKTDEEWEQAFKSYISHPEYEAQARTQNKARMTLTDFKRIWRLEFYHAMALMGIPAVFFLPAAYFMYRGRMTRQLQKYVVLAGVLMAGQAGWAWHESKEGIDPIGRTDKDIGSRKQYRLASHLALAYSQYIVFLWAGLTALLKPTTVANVAGVGALRALTCISKLGVISTVFMGAFMAGTDAGLVYTNWPAFGDHTWFPEDFFNLEPWWRNFFESQGTIQWVHRLLGYFSVGMVSAAWYYGRRLGVPNRVRLALNLLFAIAWAQAVIGITTLRSKVATSVASLHQLGSVSLVTAVVWLMHELRRLPK